MSVQSFAFLAVFSFPLGLLLGALCAFIGVPLYYRLRAVPVHRRRLSWKHKAGLTLVTALLTALLVCGVEWVLAVRAANDFDAHMGAERFWRIPLRKPYELQMRDTMDTAQIGRWRQATAQVASITHCAIIDGYVVGVRDAADRRWFLFDSATGEQRVCRDRADLVDACTRAGIVLPAWLNTVRHNWYVYWRIVDGARIDAHRIAVRAPDAP